MAKYSKSLNRETIIFNTKCIVFSNKIFYCANLLIIFNYSIVISLQQNVVSYLLFYSFSFYSIPFHLIPFHSTIPFHSILYYS